MQLRGVPRVPLVLLTRRDCTGWAPTTSALLLLSCFTGHPPVGGWSPGGPAQSRPPGGEPQFSRGAAMASRVDRLSISGTNFFSNRRSRACQRPGPRTRSALRRCFRARYFARWEAARFRSTVREKTPMAAREEVGPCVGLLRTIGLVKRQPNAPQMTSVTWRRFRGKGSSNRLTARILSP